MPILQSFGPSAGTIPVPNLKPGSVEPGVALRRHGVVPMPSLEWNDQVAGETAHLYARIQKVVPAIELPFFAPYVKAINALKKERNAVILAHNYQTPEIYNCVADFVGDSLQLAREASKVDADIIVQCGVHFMAETSKILNPEKTVLIPDRRAGCSLAASITGEDVRLLREKFPGVPVVAYVNTSADVKAEVDICCTSSNALEVVESLGRDRVIFLPDQYLANYVATQTKVKIIAWKGACEVHERFTADELRRYREGDPGLQIGTVQAFALVCGALFVSLYGGFLNSLIGLLFGTFLGVSDTQVTTLFVVATGALVVLAVWIVVVVFSRLWMQRFNFGPLEWLWRSLTYREREPLRRRTAAI